MNNTLLTGSFLASLLASLGLHLMLPLSFYLTRPAPMLDDVEQEITASWDYVSPKVKTAHPTRTASQSSLKGETIKLPQTLNKVQNGTNPKTYYLNEIRWLIEDRKIFPIASKRMRESGQVVVAFQIDRNGSIGKIRIKSECPFRRLNEAAIQLIISLGQLKPLPEAIAEDVLHVELPIEYTH